MHALHARMPKSFVLEEWLERYAGAIETGPASYAGRWAHACHPLSAADPSARFREVRLDLGCGKGSFTVESARREPDVLFVGVDFEPMCIAYAARRAVSAQVPNAVFVPLRGSDVRRVFGSGELSRIHLNFSTPFPRKKDAADRLTIAGRLMEYRDVLAPGAVLEIRTDSQPFRDFTLTQLEIAGYRVLWCSQDARADFPDAPSSEYERRLTAQGARVLGIAAVPGPRPERWEQTAELSLAEYLPRDLDRMGYVPHGMQATVENMRARRARLDARGGSA